MQKYALSHIGIQPATLALSAPPRDYKPARRWEPPFESHLHHMAETSLGSQQMEQQRGGSWAWALFTGIPGSSRSAALLGLAILHKPRNLVTLKKAAALPRGCGVGSHGGNFPQAHTKQGLLPRLSSWVDHWLPMVSEHHLRFPDKVPPEGNFLWQIPEEKS